MAIRFPIRRNLLTTRPSAHASGGSTVRSRKGLPRRTRSSGWPTIRFSSARMYAVMSGNSGIAISLHGATEVCKLSSAVRTRIETREVHPLTPTLGSE